MQAAAQREEQARLRALAEREAARELAEREQRVADCVEVVNAFFLDVVQGRASVDIAETVVAGLGEIGVLGPGHLRTVQIEAWEAAARECMKDEHLSSEEDRGLAALQQRFGLTQDELNLNGVLAAVAKCKVFTALASSLPPHVLSLAENHPVVLKKGEHPVWQFNPVMLLEDQRAGRYPVDRGLLVVTTKNLYFVGQVKSFQLPFGKIGSLVPFADGVSVGRLAVTAKPLIFQTGDGAFAHKLLSTLARQVNQ